MSRSVDFPSLEAFSRHLWALDRLIYTEPELVKALGPGMVREAQGLSVSFRQRFNDTADHVHSMALPFPPA